jgi:hypothetical protein
MRLEDELVNFDKFIMFIKFISASHKSNTLGFRVIAEGRLRLACDVREKQNTSVRSARSALNLCFQRLRR